MIENYQYFRHEWTDRQTVKHANSKISLENVLYYLLVSLCYINDKCFCLNVRVLCR